MFLFNYLEPGFPFLDALAPYQPLAMKVNKIVALCAFIVKPICITDHHWI
jgi:hypothetical protein